MFYRYWYMPFHILREHKLFLLFFLSFLVLSLSACGPNYIYQEQKDFPEGWTHADSTQFQFQIADTSQLYNVYLDIEHGMEYPYQNLYAKIHATFPSGKRKSELVSFDLSSKVGRWLGECDDEICIAKIPIHKDVFFNESGAYTYTFEQFMRINPVPELNSIQFLIEDTGKKRSK